MYVLEQLMVELAVESTRLSEIMIRLQRVLLRVIRWDWMDASLGP